MDRTARLTLTAVFAALTCIATFIIKIPVPATQGYIHFGDAFVLRGVLQCGALQRRGEGDLVFLRRADRYLQRVRFDRELILAGLNLHVKGGRCIAAGKGDSGRTLVLRGDGDLGLFTGNGADRDVNDFRIELHIKRLAVHGAGDRRGERFGLHV